MIVLKIVWSLCLLGWLGMGFIMVSKMLHEVHHNPGPIADAEKWKLRAFGYAMFGMLFASFTKWIW